MPRVAAQVLGLTLTSRDKDSDNPTAMAGFPHHQLDSYLHKLIKAGYRAAVCEQVEDPKQAKGLVKREVTRVVSAGTLTDDGLLDPREANYLAAVCLHHDKRAHKDGSEPRVGIAWAELSSGRFEAGTFPKSRIEDELARIGPAEVIYREDDVHFSPDTTAPWSWTPDPPGHLPRTLRARRCASSFRFTIWKVSVSSKTMPRRFALPAPC